MNQTKKVLLLTAPRPEADYSPVHFGDNRPPQGLGYLSAVLEQKGHKARILDLYAFHSGSVEDNNFVNQEELGEQTQIDLYDTIRSWQPHFIGMYVHTMSFEEACRLSGELKVAFPDIVQVCGGPHPSLMPESLPESFDFVVVGEGESAILDIVDNKCSQRVIKGTQLTSDELEEIPWPDYEKFWGKPYNFGLKLFDKEVDGVLTLSTSRGCPFRCQFCGVKNIYPRYVTITAQRVYDRMCRLSEKYDVKTFYFREDNFTANLKRLETFCNLNIEGQKGFQWVCESRVRELSEELIAKMAKAGCIGLYIGCESGSPEVLEKMMKDETVEDYLEKFSILKQHGISTYTTWVYGTPGETPGDRRLTKDLIKTLSPTKADEFIFIGIPRSEFYDQCMTQNQYEFIDKNGFLYPSGYLSLAKALYGNQDPRVRYVERIYDENNITPVGIEW